MLDDRPKARGFSSHDRGIPHDRHLLANVSDAETEIKARLFTGRQPHALAAHRLEARKLDIEAVLAGSEARSRVGAVGRRIDYALLIRGDIRDGNGGARHRATV